jgi:phosphatidate cytidylyltransferase
MAFAVTGLVYPGLLLAMIVLVATYDKTVGRWYILILFAAVWLGDTGAYFAGRFLGRHKLHPSVSPKKTWEGAVGGVLGSIGGVFAVKGLFVHHLPVLDAIVIGAVSAVLEQVGDLAESLFKRSFEVKDSGGVLPGHGGMLDRIDGLLFAAPFMWIYVEWLRPGFLA